MANKGHINRLKRLKSTFSKRFWERVDIRSEDECWTWKGGRSHFGYGVLGKFGALAQSHRVSWELCVGQIPEGLCVLHHCDNPPCCNPKHLFLGTRTDNVLDMKSKGRGKSGRTKLSANDVRSIRKIYSDGVMSMQKIGDAFGVHWNTIQSVISGEFHKHVI